MVVNMVKIFNHQFYPSTLHQFSLCCIVLLLCLLMVLSQSCLISTHSIFDYLILVNLCQILTEIIYCYFINLLYNLQALITHDLLELCQFVIIWCSNHGPSILNIFVFTTNNLFDLNVLLSFLKLVNLICL